MPFNFYDTHTLLMAVEQLTPPTSFLRDRYFPTNDMNDLFATTDVLVEYKDGTKKLAPFVAPRKGGVPILRQGYEMKSFTPPNIAPSRPLSIDDIKKRGFGEALLTTLTPEQRQYSLVLKDAQELSEYITRREEWMCAEVMQTNGCIMKHIADDATEADEMEVRYYSEGSNPAKFTPSTNWTKDYDGITADIAAMAKLLTRRGLPARELVCGGAAAEALMNNTEIQKRLDIKNYDAGRIDPATLPNGAAHIATLNIQGRLIDVICYDEVYTDDDGDTQAFIGDKNVVLTAPGAGRLCYGAVSQIEQSDGLFHTYTGRRVPKYLSEPQKNTRSLTMTSCPLPMPIQKNPFIVATVLA